MNPEAQIEFLTGIIRANRLHESHCAAFTTSRGGLFDTFHSIIEKTCHCWLDQNNLLPEGKVIAAYNKETKDFDAELFRNRYWACKALLSRHPDLSGDPESPNYWGNTYLLIEAETKTEEESNDGENHSDPA